MPHAKTIKVHRVTDASRARVETAIACGLTQPETARLIGVSLSTLLERYPDELALGAQKANMVVAQQLYRVASGRNKKADVRTQVQASIAWLKMRGGAAWQEGPAVVVNAGTNANVDVKAVLVNLQHLPDDELRGLADALAKVLPAPDDKP